MIMIMIMIIIIIIIIIIIKTVYDVATRGGKRSLLVLQELNR